ncbi:MAG: HU family DNA-binding protein [Spirochaetales bacterium]|nr:HU family DNA-binding protein [Spirochaetales bacterium]
MGMVLAQLPEKIQKHLSSILAGTDMPQDDNSLEILAHNWVGKREIFDTMIKNLAMHEEGSLAPADARAALLLTYSGSLIGLGPERGDGRWMEYASIKLRHNVPEIVAVEKTGIQDMIAVDATASFTEGKIKSTSALFKIAVCDPDVDLAEQEKRVKEAMIFLTNVFVKLNRKSFAPDEAAPEQFNLASMTKFLANKNNLTQKQVKAMLADLFSLIETGVLLGERVALGKLGSISLKLRPARKPRVMKNRFTGGEITVPAMPERYGPKISFSKRLKERAAEVKPEAE